MEFFVVLEKFTCAYLFQIALEIIRLPMLTGLMLVTDANSGLDSIMRDVKFNASATV